MTDWEVFHTYYRYVRRGMLEGITCPTDEWVLHYRADKNFEPILVCAMCQSRYTPGLNVYNEMKAEIERVQLREKQD